MLNARRSNMTPFAAWLVRGVVALCAAFGGANLASGQLVPKDKPAPVRGLELVDRRGQQVAPSTPVFDEDGNAVELGSFFNRDGKASSGSSRQFKKPIVVMMVYFSCPLQCPQTLEGLHAMVNGVEDFAIGNEYDVLVISFDPRDKPRDAASHKLASLLSYKHPTDDRVRDGWRFLTTPPASARAIADQLGFPFRYLPESGEFGHPTVLYVLTPEGKVSRNFNGVQFPARDLRFALLEASDGRIGDSFDSFAFWCYHFDPESGSYTLQAMRVMQLGAMITVVVLGVLLAILLRSERRKARRAAAIAGELAAEKAAFQAELRQAVDDAGRVSSGDTNNNQRSASGAASAQVFSDPAKSVFPPRAGGGFGAVGGSV